MACRGCGIHALLPVRLAGGLDRSGRLGQVHAHVDVLMGIERVVGGPGRVRTPLREPVPKRGVSPAQERALVSVAIDDLGDDHRDWNAYDAMKILQRLDRMAGYRALEAAAE